MLTMLSMSASSLRRDSRMRSKVTRTSCSKLIGLLSGGIATPTCPATKTQLPASVSIRSASLKLLAIGLARCRIVLMMGPFPASGLDGGGPFGMRHGEVARAFVNRHIQSWSITRDVRNGADSAVPDAEAQ